MQHLLDALKAKPEMARAVLQQHLTRLVFYPDLSGGRAVFHVIGQLDMFTPADGCPSSSEDGELLGCLGN